MRSIATCTASLILTVTLAGCGDGKSSVKGTVTLDGQPVANGSITFVRTEGGLVREGAVIHDGRFEARMPPGVYKIELNSQKVVGTSKQKSLGGGYEAIDVTEELFSPWFNVKSELSIQVTAGGTSLPLDLQSKR